MRRSTAAAGGPAPWDEVGVEGDVTALELRDLVGQVMNAARQVLHAGEAAQIAQAKDVLRDTRRKLYRILAEDSPETPASTARPRATPSRTLGATGAQCQALRARRRAVRRPASMRA